MSGIYPDLANGGRPTTDKDPDAVLDYLWDLASWLADVGDTVSSYSFLVEGGLAVNSHSESAGVITAWISGGTVGVEASVTCRVVTAAGRIDDRTIFFNVQPG